MSQPPQDPAPTDLHGRPLRSLRLSVTDRCNLRCAYCMPAENYTWLPKSGVLRFEELEQLVDVFVGLGVTKLRLTGGEPLLRRDLEDLVARLARRPGIEDLALTTNGMQLGAMAGKLKAAGLDRLTLSLDTLRADRFQQLTRRDGLADTLAGIEAARAAGFERTKVNTVVMRGFNDDELLDLVNFAGAGGLELRFIEYMDVAGASDWRPGDVVSRAEILGRLGEHFGPVEPLSRPEASAPAERFRLANGQVVGVIASTTSPFCGSCDRARLTADGQFFRCLYAAKGTDLRSWVREGRSTEELRAGLAELWAQRGDRGAEERLAQGDRRPLGRERLEADPHLEMHTRGG